jgi:hypothetical protein
VSFPLCCSGDLLIEVGLDLVEVFPGLIHVDDHLYLAFIAAGELSVAAPAAEKFLLPKALFLFSGSRLLYYIFNPARV